MSEENKSEFGTLRPGFKISHPDAGDESPENQPPAQEEENKEEDSTDENQETTQSNETEEDKVTKEEEKSEETSEDETKDIDTEEVESSKKEEETTEDQESSLNENKESDEEEDSYQQVTYKDVFENLGDSIEEYFEGELDFNDYMFFKNEDFENMDSDEGIERYLLMNKEEGIETDLDLEFRMDKFKVLDLDPESDEYNEYLGDNGLSAKDVRAIENEYEKLLRKAEGYFNDQLDRIDEFDSQNGLRFAQEKEQTNNISPEEWSKTVDDTVSKFVEMKAVAKNEKGEVSLDLKFEPTQEEISSVAEVLKKPERIYSLWMNDKGEIDEDKMLQSIYLIQNQEKIFNQIHKEGIPDGAKKIIKEMNNVSDKAKSAEKSTKGMSESMEKAAKEAFGE